MCIPVPVNSSICFNCRLKSLRNQFHWRKMSLQKKNVILGFVKEDYVPIGDQFLVKYSSGKGNNLHEVDCIDGSTILVSMPKKYRHTVWLKKEDCLVIDPIEEGKKVKGEIVCLLPCDTVRDLIENRQWPSTTMSSKDPPHKVEDLLHFFSTSLERQKSNKDDRDDMFPSTDSSDPETDEDGEEEDEEEMEEDDVTEEEEDDDVEAEADSQEKVESTRHINGNGTHLQDADEEIVKKVNHRKSDNPSSSTSISSDLNSTQEDDENEDSLRDRNRSRVQLVSSGIVTVTNVLTEGLLENDMQSLEFGADEDEDDVEEETSSNVLSNSLQRHANTIRIQVNYNK